MSIFYYSRSHEWNCDRTRVYTSRRYVCSNTKILLHVAYSEKGCPYADPTTAQHFGGDSIKGLVLLQDTQVIENLAHFSQK